MSNSNRRVREHETVHHLVSRIAHRVYFLKEDERKDLLEMVRRAAEFTGVMLLGWCVMGNHFHVLAFLPRPEMLDEQEILRRYAALKGAEAASGMAAEIAAWRKDGDAGERRVSEWLERQRRRMYDVGSFMKIVKQWFTEEYNRRNAHKGTLWEAAYFDRLVKRNEVDMSKCLAYINLNPVRAAETDRFDGYAWSSYAAFRRGDPAAVSGMKFVYGEEVPLSDVSARHEALMQALLEKEKQRRAEEIARKRAAGYEVPADPLTSEALVAQTAAHLAEVQRASMELRSELDGERRRSARRDLRDREVLSILTADPEIEVPLLAERLAMGLSVTYGVLARLRKKGLIERDRRSGRWSILTA